MGGVATLSYDPAGNVAYAADALGGRTAYEHDGFGNITKAIDAAKKVAAYVYDKNGNLISATDPDGYVTTYAYNGIDLVASINYNGGKSVGYSYNAAGDLVQMDDWTGTTAYEYDSIRRVARMEYPDGWSEGYAYDSAWRLLSTYDTDPSSKNLKQQKNAFLYDGCGNMVYEYMRGNRAGEATVEVVYAYDALHRVVSADETYGKKSRHYQYDSIGNLTFESNSNNDSWHYKLNNLNKVTSKADAKGKENNAYAYDGRGNLVKRCATHDYDQVLGLFYAKARFYDAVNRSFASMDPILDPSRYDPRQFAADPGKLVQFLYARNAPLTDIDPLGLDGLYINDVKAAEAT